jgi:F420-dependent oxidoreductase-like protein
MKLGVTAAYWGLGVLGRMASETERIALGSAVFQIPGRSAAMTAMTAATLDQLSGGRFMLGLGVSGPQVSEGWHGVRFARQLERTRDYVAIVRKVLAREVLVHEGETITLPLPDGPGKALKLMIRPVQERIPILLAAMGPRNVALAGEVADGWIPLFFSPEHVAELRAPLAEGARRASRDPGDVAIYPQVAVCLDDDLDAARDAMRPMLALYVGGMGSRERNFYTELMARYGFEREARAVQELYLAGNKAEAAAALPAELIDATCLCGPPDVIRRRLHAYEASGVETLILAPQASDADALVDQLRGIAELRPTSAPVA